MHSESRLWDLVSQWQRQCEEGTAPSLPELCGDCLELLPQLRRHLAACRRMEQLAGQDRQDVDTSAQTRVRKEGHDTGETDRAVNIPGYEVLELLGRGGMGVVYKARQLGLNRLVALKMIRAGLHAGEQERTRFLAEAEATARLQHPNVVQVFQVGQHEGNPFLSLEFVEGGTLAARIRGEPQQPQEAAQLVETLALAVQAAHDRGIVHRDLKPGNVLLASGERQSPDSAASGGRQSPGGAAPGDCRPPLANVPKIADFGLAKRDDAERTASGAIVGTPAYMAPEQARGDSRAVGPAADVYALGAILYELLTGRAPFKSATGWDTMQLVLHTEAISPTRLQPSVPRDLETICLKCLHKEPARRYASATALAADCRAFLEGRPIAARRTGFVERGWRWAKRRPAAASLLVVSCLATLVFLGLGFWFSARLGELGVEHQAEQEHATTQRYHALRQRVQERSARREPGWTWANLDDLAEAAQLRDAASDVRLLRNEAMLCLGSRDVRLTARLCQHAGATSLAWHPNNKQLAVGLSARVILVDLERPDQEKSLACPAAPIANLAFSPDGRWLVAALGNGLLMRWDLNQADPQAVSWRAHPDNVGDIAFAHRGDVLYSWAGSVLKRWDGASQQETRTATLAAPITALAVNPVEGWLAAAAGHLHCLQELSLGSIRPPLAESTSCLCWFPDGRSLVLALGRTLSLRDVHSHCPPRPLLIPGTGHSEEGDITDLAVSPDGALILAACRATGHLKVWDVVSGQLRADLVAGGSCRVAFAPDSRSFAVCGERDTCLYAVRELQEHAVVALQGEVLNSFALHPDGRSLACVCAGLQDGASEILFWPFDASTRQPSRRKWLNSGASREPYPLAFSGREGWLALVLPREKQLHFHHVFGTQPALALAVANAPATLSFATDGRLWTDGGDSLSGWELPRREPVASWRNIAGGVMTGRAEIVAVAAGESCVVAAGRDGSVRLLPTGSGILEVEARRTVVTESLRSATVDEQQGLALVGSERGSLTLVRLPALDVLAQEKAHADALDHVAITANGLLASSSRDGTVKLWRWDGRVLVELWSWRGGRSVSGLSFRADGVTLAVLLQGERGVRLWHLERLWGRLAQLNLDAGLGTLTATPLPPPNVPRPSQPVTEKAPHGVTLELFADGELGPCVAVRHPWNIDWDLRREPQGAVPPQQLRFSGWLKARRQGTYFLGVHCAGPCRVFLDGRLCLDGWAARLSEFRHRIEVNLTDNPHHLRVEYRAWAAAPFVRLFWARPSPNGFGERTIPPEHLFRIRAHTVQFKRPPLEATLVRTFDAQPKQVYAVALSPDGKRALSGCGDGVVRLWDVDTGAQLRSLSDHRGPVNSVAFLPDGRRALSAGVGNAIRLWDLKNGKIVRRLEGHTASLECLAVAPDGQRIASGSGQKDPTVRVWEVESGKELICFRGHEDVVAGVCWTPDSKRVVSSSWDGSVRVHNVTRGPREAVFTNPGSCPQQVVSVRGGQCVAVPSRNEGKVRLYHLEQQRVLHVWEIFEPTLGPIASSPDGSLLAVGGGARVYFYDPHSGRYLGRLRCDAVRVNGLAFTPNGRSLLTAAGQKMQLWHIAAGGAQAKP